MPADSQSPTDNSGTASGFLPPQGNWGDFNLYSFIVLQWLAKLQTATPVKIIACTNDGGLSPFGFVDVLPLVNQIDSQGNATPHTTIFNLPYFRLQGGTDAVIIDPKPGDIGMAIFASRDISKVKATQAQANPGSFRQFSFSDGIYLGGLLNGTPVQVVQFNADGITIKTPNTITLDAPLTVITGVVEVQNVNSESVASTLNGTFKTTGGDIIADTISLKDHVHSGVQPGSGDTGLPVP